MILGAPWFAWIANFIYSPRDTYRIYKKRINTK